MSSAATSVGSAVIGGHLLRHEFTHKQESEGTEIKTRSAQIRFEEAIVHIISDDHDGTKRLRKFLASKGLTVSTFASAAAYIVAQRDSRPACLILDLVLPGVDGLEVQERLAGIGGPPIIFVTARADSLSIVLAMKNGAIDFLIEPIDYAQLITGVELAFAEDLRKRKELAEVRSLLARWQT